MNDFEDFCKLMPETQTKILYEKIELSTLSHMINIMRTKLGNKPLSHAMKDPQILKVAIEEIQRINKMKKEDELYNNPKTKLFGMMLRAKRLREEEK